MIEVHKEFQRNNSAFQNLIYLVLGIERSSNMKSIRKENYEEDQLYYNIWGNKIS